MVRDPSGGVRPNPPRVSAMRELYAELLLQAGQPKQALREFEASLRTVPNRRRSLLGAAMAAADAGEHRRAEAFRRQWVAQTAPYGAPAAR